MARTQLRLGMLLVLLMFMAGCIYSDTPQWGEGDGQIHAEIKGDESVVIKSKLGDDYEETIALTGCGDSKMEISGMLISSQLYSEHPELSDVRSAMGAAVIIHEMSWNSAKAVEEGKAGRISIKDWSDPFNPSEAVGSKLSDNEEDWEIIGIIPASENIANGLNVLQHWHQPIELTGYALEGDGLAEVNSETCELVGQKHGMVVTKIKTEQGVVSLDGDHDDEYSLGDTDIFGGWTFVLFFLIFGVGGGVGLYVVSTMVIRQGAKATAETLLGREGFAKAVQMKKDLRKSKKEGLESPAERVKRTQKSSPPQRKKKKENDVAIPGFSLDSVLQSDSSDDLPKTFGGGGSVVVTAEAKEIEATQYNETPISEISNRPMPSAGVTTTQSHPPKREHFSSSMSRSTAQTPMNDNQSSAGRPVKRRAVKKRATTKPEPEEQLPVEHKRSSVVDDDFSDFSF